jgi:mevalonate kinase
MEDGSSILHPPSSASAPGKLILCGEHAVVYGRPALALPLFGVRARAEVANGAPSRGIAIHAENLGRRWLVAEDSVNPLSELVVRTLGQLAVTGTPDLAITLTSDIPIASGMGSGAAVATALVRALALHFSHVLEPAEVSALVYASEQRYHGTPSGIDNNVIAYEQPIWFERSNTPLIEPIAIAAPFTLLIGDTGIHSATRAPVGEVRRRWQARPAQYERLFDQVGMLVIQAREALAQGDIQALGPLLDQNHALLQRIGVSSPELDRLVSAARKAGALGAKLSGAGWGGVMLALVTEEERASVTAALASAGAARVLATAIEPHTPPVPPARIRD